MQEKKAIYRVSHGIADIQTTFKTTYSKKMYSLEDGYQKIYSPKT